jgi:hypothetical protein
MPCVLVEEPYMFYPHVFSYYLEKLMQIFMGMTKKHVERLLFCLGNSKPLSLRSGLLLPYMLGLDIISFLKKACFCCFSVLFLKKKKKNWGSRCRILFYFSFDSFSDITCIFAWYLNSLCGDWICLYMIESLYLTSAKFSCCILMLDSCFSHAMKNCALSKAPQGTFCLLSNF